MRYKLKKIVVPMILAPLALVLTQFTSCDSYTPVDTFQGSSVGASSCSGSLCFSSDEQDLRIYSAQTQIHVALTQNMMNVAGYCDEGGFPNNLIYWEVRDGVTQAIRYSTDSNSMNLSSFSCIDGRFALSVQVPQGLFDSFGVKKPHDLKLRIVGIDSSGKLYSDGSNASASLSLIPLIVN